MADEKATAAPKDGVPAPAGPEMEALRGRAPAIMAELMDRFIAARELNGRARVRMQMKAMLDLFSVDTEYPPVPALNEEQALAQRMGDALGIPRRGARYVAGQPPQIGVGHPVPPMAPGADELRRAVEGAVQDGGEAEVAPAPGAPVADTVPAAPGPGEEFLAAEELVPPPRDIRL
ncbi:MAG: hypothetical protein L0027_08885 [Candidatus Rokubacteria bacterium]|nr:hypothetical protein [Candidatus Rokubacteria bacterium]